MWNVDLHLLLETKVYVLPVILKLEGKNLSSPFLKFLFVYAFALY